MSPDVSLHEDFKIFLNENDLAQEVKKATRDANTLDLIATNIHERVIRTEVLPGISDYSCVLTEISMIAFRDKTADYRQQHHCRRRMEPDKEEYRGWHCQINTIKNV